MRLIDADELERVFIGKHYGVNAIKYFIKMQPTIDTVPVKHGRWEVIGQPYMRKHFNPVCCSICKRRGYNTPYCPHCGASMSVDGENDG